MPRPLLAIDPGPTVLRWGWFLWVTWAVIGTGLLAEDVTGHALTLGLVLSAPFWALWLLWPLYRAWALLMRWRGHAGGQPWQEHPREVDERPEKPEAPSASDGPDRR
jgi:hypothetical protein